MNIFPLLYVVEQRFCVLLYTTDSLKFEGITLNLDLSPISLNLNENISPLQTFINNHSASFAWDQPITFSQWWMDDSINFIISNPDLFNFLI